MSMVCVSVVYYIKRGQGDVMFFNEYTSNIKYKYVSVYKKKVRNNI